MSEKITCPGCGAVVDEACEETLVTQAEVDDYWEAQYKVTTITPLVENPVKTVRILNQEELDELLEGYNEYAEFLVEIVKLESKIIN